ncbi:hypothetical protein [Senegalia massiliensis]|nr:hypothetical protein [Senegalia massiliensis]
MQKEFKNKFNKWYEDLRDKKLILTNDIDSLASCYVLNRLFGCKVRGFYDFKQLGYTNSFDRKGFIGVDMDAVVKNATVFGNHVTYFKNPDVVSLNKDITRANYTNKFAGSTLITILSLYNIDLSSFTEEQLEVLISVDVAFKQYYFNKDLFKYYYNDILQYPIFTKIVGKHNKQYFYNIIRKYNLHKDINLKNGFLHTEIDLQGLSFLFDIDLTLPKDKFEVTHRFFDEGINLSPGNIKILEKERNRIFSSALIYKNTLKYSAL